MPAVHQQPRLVLVNALPSNQSDVGEAAADPLQITRLAKAVVNLRVGLLLTLLLVLLVLPGRIRTARSAGTYLSLILSEDNKQEPCVLAGPPGMQASAS
uniref:hypothetical protein n=1 Tax=Streptomyces cellulosae TaxID=1968 RepID=UPI002F910D07